jgi:hypothetical protein
MGGKILSAKGLEVKSLGIMTYRDFLLVALLGWFGFVSGCGWLAAR